MGNIVIPGQKLCPKCREKFRYHLQNQDDEPDVYELSSENQPDSESENADYNQSFIVSNSRDTLNAALGELELSPYKVHSLPKCSKITHGKIKLGTGTSSCPTENSFNSYCGAISIIS